MRIFKFGGASIKDAAGVKNVASILTANNSNDVLVVISAMGKTTNALESVIHHCYHKTGEAQSALQVVFDYHNAILSELFESSNLFGVSDIKNLLVNTYLPIYSRFLLDKRYYPYQTPGYSKILHLALDFK